jgi:hypothetical protein
MVYVKCNEDGTFKSVDKFYDQEDLAIGLKLLEQKQET